MFILAEFVDSPYNKFPTVKIPETRRVYDKFHACFNINKVKRVVLVFLLARTHLGIKRRDLSLKALGKVPWFVVSAVIRTCLCLRLVSCTTE
jgi:hypothetical protein